MPCIIHEIKGHGPAGVNIYLGSWLNKLLLWFGNFMIVRSLIKNSKVCLYGYNHNLITISKVKDKFLNREKIIFTVSPSILPQPSYWPKHVQVVGYYERSKTLNWRPAPRLIDFLEKYNKILFITFGSMVNANPGKTTKIVLNIIKKNNIPAVISTFWGGLKSLFQLQQILCLLTTFLTNGYYQKCML